MVAPREVVGNNIKGIRLKQGLSGSELADLLSYSQQHISRIERGLIRLNIEQIQYIANGLGVRIEELLDGIGFQTSPLVQIYSQACYFQGGRVS
ncbi:helix-turn-helix domain-containing protein [Providencia stuartii]|uniref:helix-turn-helix domain-containing protein n=1 Tax=Providencia stuartii TaxID=588 RepID=UPI0024AA68AF|nr:helix-turn-helix transcriptional regulator [Providencia stuartii]MCX3071368.1 helix-turn-helix transcriptional regulator [Providencia stuartii]